MDDILLLNPDIIEIVLSHIHEMACVLNGVLTIGLGFLSHDEVGGASYYLTENLFKHASLEALDPELISVIRDELYVRDEEFLGKISEPRPERLRLKGIDMLHVKYSQIDFNVVEYYNYLYNKLEKQTNNFDPVELGKRVVLLPGNIPPNFEGIIKTFEPLTEEFKLYSKFIKSTYGLDETFKNPTSLNEFMDLHGIYSCDPELYKEKVCEFMASREDNNGLSITHLESYREKYEACITVTPENCRLYTRARFIFNMFIQLNEYIMKYIASNPNMGCKDSLSRIYEYIGLAARNILTNQHELYLDNDNYPTLSELYRSGSIKSRLFPESINYTKIQKLCFCEGCKPFMYSAQLYEGNDGKVYILVNLQNQHYTTYIDFIVKNKCMYDLFIHDIEYHYGRLEALDEWRYKVEVTNHRKNYDLLYLIEILKEVVVDWFSPIRRIYMRMVDADRIFYSIKNAI